MIKRTILGLIFSTSIALGQTISSGPGPIPPSINNLSGLGTGVATLLGGTSSGTGGPAGTSSPVFAGTVSLPTTNISGVISQNISSDGSLASFRRVGATNNLGFSLSANESADTVNFNCTGSSTPVGCSYQVGNTTILTLTTNSLIITKPLFFSGTIPTVSGTGSPSITTDSTDTAGEVTAGASATSIVITFSSAKSNKPFCIVQSQTQLSSFSYTISATAITITQTATTGNIIEYHCFQH